MANSLSASFADYWSRRMQVTNYRTAVYRAIVSMEEQSTLQKGDVVHRPYRSTLYPRTYTRGTAVTISDITDTDETLTVDVAKVVPFYVDDLDALQHNYKVLNEYADDSSEVLTNWIDGDVLGEAISATSNVDDSEINNGTDGRGFTLTTANILKMFVEAKKKLQKQNIRGKTMEGGLKSLFGVISPEVESVLLQFLSNRESALGDSTGTNGHIGSYMGFDLYVSNGLTFEATLEVGSAATAGDTITINTVVFTAAATPAASGEFDVESTGAAQITTLVLAINNGTGYAPGIGSADTYIEITAANRDLLQGVTASAVSTTGVKIVCEGLGLITVSETLTAAADVWTGNKQIQHQLFGRKGAIDLVIQKRPNVEIKEVPDKLGKNIIPWTLYGLKTFLEGRRELVDVRVRADSGQGAF